MAASDDKMVVEYEESTGILSVKWSDELSVESSHFQETIASLFGTIIDKKVVSLIVDSGTPSGGVLTEQVISQFIQHIPGTPLRNIAILESTDYLWDYNLVQVIKLLVSSYDLPIAVELMKGSAAARKWIASEATDQLQ
ncbi:hypothetical protein H9Q13_17340 [Pontibacter sp. JH31]|uniref:STAS/SEC14 domain-containing protein n=1 Tax=Pontibacter aquaedesilientis TaxID=2766980 RepID=A0ABR7XMR2_9BACT|nr:hypothetical protein [Pontibacter aquaedesilientis]MBD1398938.1 hypothetical protein [Pontibacter aquaedesilientis]